MPENPEDWPVVSRYTRKQAIEDGVLIDVSSKASIVGFAAPVAITSELYARLETGHDTGFVSNHEPLTVDRRIWILLGKLLFAVKCNLDNSRIDLMLQFPGEDPIQCYALAGPGDAEELVITVMLPHED